jgi:subtilisin family serine protease
MLMTLTRLLPLFAVLLIVSCFSAEAQQPPVLTHENEQAVHIQPARPASSVALASGALRSAVERLERGQTLGPAVDVVDSKMRVEVLHDLESSEIRAVITDLGGTVEGEVEGVLVQALMPFDRLVALESHDGVQFVRPPLEANVPILPPSDGLATLQNGGSIVGEEVSKTSADEWHGVGYTGAGVNVGIVDYFDGTLWSNAQAAGELSTPAGTFCQVDGAPCDIWTIFPGAEHGQAVAEVIHEMAPGAQLYLATVDTVTDLQAAVDYFDTQGVDIISRSLTAKYDGPGDGTGPIATVIDNAVADGMVWFNSAGNSANDGSYYGSYWRGQWADANVNDWLDFQPGDELMGFGCWFINGVRWSDFGAGSPTDYDVCVFDDPGATTLLGCSVNDQTIGAPPLELDLPCNSDGDGVDYLAINLYDAGGETSGDVLEFMTNGSPVEYWQNPYSASGPASDTASPGGLSIGAVDPPLGTDIAYYSSQGPTNDGLYGGMDRIKPDISAAAGVASYTYGTFAGTSASTPAAAGAAALIIEAGLASTPAEVKTYLLSNATVDRGAAGPDNVFGVGELVLDSIDADGDGIPDPLDNCLTTANPGQEDVVHPGDGGDACEDYDSDTVVDADDNCPDDANPGQEDFEPDGIGDACDHSDGDDFIDAVELYLSTDPLDACPDEIGVHDAWPLDITMDRMLTVAGDVLNFRDRIGATPGSPEWSQRLDLNMDSVLTVAGDVLLYRDMIGETCT